MVIEKPWPDCGCPLSINFKTATYDRVPFPHSCGISKDEYHRHYICDHEVYLTLSVSKINTTTGQWVAKRLKEGRLFVIRGPPRPKPKKKVPAWKVQLRSLSPESWKTVSEFHLYIERCSLEWIGLYESIPYSNIIVMYTDDSSQPSYSTSRWQISHQQPATWSRMRYWLQTSQIKEVNRQQTSLRLRILTPRVSKL